MTEEQRIKRNQRMDNWKKENRERINILFPIGTKDRIRAAADELNISVSEFVLQAINEKLKNQ